jgi:hypothetical protein
MKRPDQRIDPMDARRRVERITAFAALGTVLLMVPVVVVGLLYPAPTSSEPAAQLVTHLSDHRVVILLSLYLSALGWGGLLLVFAGGLWAILRRAEGDPGVWSLVAFGACSVTAAAILVFDTLFGAIVYRAPAIDAAVLSVLYDSAAVANQMTAFPNAIYTGAAAIVIGRTSVLPRWIAAGALLVAAIHLLSTMSLARTGVFSPWGVLPSIAPLSHTAWLAAVAFVLLRR